MSQSIASRDNPGVIARPPLILIGFISLGLALDWLMPAAFLPLAVQYAVGGVLIALALVLASAAMVCLARAGTNIPTCLPATALVAGGPYRFSRNPIYVAMILLVLGIGMMADSVWIVGLAIPFALVLRYGVIAREERYLEAKFRDSYRAYRARVRRWI
jgi:protein-S-isoprenylcysteine O-methyltransferase Ste14